MTKIVFVVLAVVMWCPFCPCQTAEVIQKCGLPKIDRGDGTRPPEKNKDTDTRFKCYASAYDALADRLTKEAGANAALLKQIEDLQRQNAELKQEAAKPVQVNVSGHLFDKKAFPDSACVAKATTTLNALGGTYLANDASSVSFLLNSRYVLVECNGWPASVTVSGRDSGTAVEASRIENLVFPTH